MNRYKLKRFETKLHDDLYAEIIKAEAERQHITVDKVVHTAFRKFLERRQADAGK